MKKANWSMWLEFQKLSPLVAGAAAVSFKILGLLTMLILFAGAGFLAGYALQNERPEPSLPTFRQLQERLNAEGYPCKVDGIIGKETLGQWDRYLCDQYAIADFKRIKEMEK